MKKMSWYVSAIVGTTAVVTAVGALPASPATSEPAHASAATSTTSTGLWTSVGTDGVTATGTVGLKKKIWEW